MLETNVKLNLEAFEENGKENWNNCADDMNHRN
jgi:hypothetical protein